SFKGAKAISAMLCIHNNSYAHYLLGGYDESSKHRGAGVLSMWEGIIYAKSLGLKYFDFEGSMVPEIEKYFRGFGGVLTPYFRVNKAKLPLEIFLKFYKRELF
ncbi:MAG TPA: GNAT family N-acetyltransferase, partial [bacterium]|nr:GNAT family N-acetyltransferase [bacterium]